MMGAGIPGIGQRVNFNGDGGKLFGTYLLFAVVPAIVAYFVLGIFYGIGFALESALRSGGIVMMLFSLVGMLVMLAGVLTASVLFANKFYAFYYEALSLDGQQCQYIGTPQELAKVMLINMILSSITCGIYTPWAIVRMKEFVHSKVLVGGQPNRLTFHGDPASLLGTYILNMLLVYCTFGIYGPWMANNIFAFMWENTKLDGRGYQFRKDPGGFFGTYLLTIILSMITCNIYYPWGICTILKWEAERVA